jgi:hypothetical protein
LMQLFVVHLHINECINKYLPDTIFTQTTWWGGDDPSGCAYTWQMMSGCATTCCGYGIKGLRGSVSRVCAALATALGRKLQQRKGPHKKIGQLGRRPAEGRPHAGRRPAEGRPKAGRRPDEGRPKAGRRPAFGRPKADRRPVECRPKVGRMPAYWFIGLLVYRINALLVYRFIGLSVYWFIGLSVYWFIGLLFF